MNAEESSSQNLPNESSIHMVETLRSQIGDRVRLQQQLIGVSAAVAAAELSFFASRDETSALVPALFSLVFVGLALAIIRNDQEITFLARHVLNRNLFGEYAITQARWELFRFQAMQQDGFVVYLLTAAQVVASYGLPVLAAIASAVASLSDSPSDATWAALSLAAVFMVLFIASALDVASRYRQLGLMSKAMLDEIDSSASVREADEK